MCFRTICPARPEGHTSAEVRELKLGITRTRHTRRALPRTTRGRPNTSNRMFDIVEHTPYFRLLTVCLAVIGLLSQVSAEESARNQDETRWTIRRAGVSVITADDLRRSGASTLAEALRFVPGYHVARIDSNTWAVSSRGFTEIYSDGVQVFLDGRSLYSPFFGGTHWREVDLAFDEIDRIEVYSGPGPASAGANATNGAIYIYTKSAEDTIGGVLRSAWGSEIRHSNSLIYGVALTDTLKMRLSGKYSDYDASFSRDGFGSSELGIRAGEECAWIGPRPRTTTLQFLEGYLQSM